MQRFPLLDSAPYSYARNFSLEHRGTDIMAPQGTPVLAVERGRAWSAIEDKGGKVVYLEGASGLSYFYGHLSQWATKVISATPTSALEVDAGDVLGLVGSTGNAEGRPPHLHFQMRRGSLQIDPFDSLERVDLQRRGTDPQRQQGSAVLVLAALWFLSKHKWGRS